MTETQSNTQSVEFQALLKAQGLDPEKYRTPEALAEELGSSKRKIKAQDRKERKLERALREKHTKEEDESINAEFPDDPKMQKMARENQELKRDGAKNSMELWLIRNPDYEKLRDEVEEIIASDPDVMMVSDSRVQLNLAMKQARANAGSPSGAPEEAGGHHLPRGAHVATGASGVPPGFAGAGQDYETKIAEATEKMKAELAAAKGDIAEKKQIASKYDVEFEKIRKNFGTA
jgi:hypothetical protein